MAKFVKVSSPYIRKEVTTKRMMSDVLIALLPLVIYSIFKFGAQALLKIVVASFVMVVAEVLSVMIRHKPHPKVEGFKARTLERLKQVSALNIITPLISAVIFSLMIPSTLPIYVLIVSSLIGIVVGKLVFGGLGSNIFNPAAVSFVVAHVSFIGLFNYPQIDAIAGATPLDAFNNLKDIPNVLKNYSIFDLFLGNIPGGMGEISALLILIGGAYLFIRKAADWRIFVSMVGTFIVLMLVAGLAVDAKSVHLIMLYQLLSGGLLFGAVFMATDPVTAPVTKPGRMIYGLILGVLVVFIRLFGANPEGVAYALLITNMFVPLIDYHKWSKSQYSWKMWVGYGAVMLIAALVVFLGRGGF